MLNPYRPMPLVACFDGEQPPDEVPIADSQTVDSPVDEMAEVQPVEAPEPHSRVIDVERLADAEQEHRKQLVERSLLTAAHQSDAFYAPQILPFLQPFATIISDGHVVVTIEGFVMNPCEAIEWMKNQPHRYGNLFKDAVFDLRHYL